MASHWHLRAVCFDTQDVTLKQRQLNRMYTVHYSSCFHVIMNYVVD